VRVLAVGWLTLTTALCAVHRSHGAQVRAEMARTCHHADRYARGTGLKRAPRLGSVAQVADGFGSGPAGR
jgi:hypothetical protein